MNRSLGRRDFSDLPDEIVSACKQTAKEISDQNNTIRDKKVFAAKLNISSGYYNSDHVFRIIASCLLLEGSIW